ncbi:hypothetical protein chiPu_0032631, partial [Chiloscyllium punctatum]|nr:hypothetical protein [Chiloscyllium punctatum]
AQFGFYEEHAQCHITHNMASHGAAFSGCGYDRLQRAVCGRLTGRKERREFTSRGYR